jgi:hypothetical protein
MAKYHGKIGYATSTEVNPGVWTDTISEREYYGDVIRETKEWRSNPQAVNDNLTVGNRLSIVADDFAFENFSAMRYAIWAGVYWKVNSIEIQRPRLILSIGGVYNGIKG